MNKKFGSTQYKTIGDGLMAIIEHVDESVGGLHDIIIVTGKGIIKAIYHSFKKLGQI